MAVFLENIIFGKHYLGVEFFTVGNEDKIAFLQLDRKKNELIIARNVIFESAEALKKEKSKFPLSLVINNKNVLQKEIDGIESNDKKLLYKAFPNIAIADFYYEIIYFDNKSIVSICRKTYVDELIDSLNESFRIASVSLGISPVKQLANFNIPKKIYTNSQVINFESEEKLLDSLVETSSPFYDINGLNIQSTYILSFSSVLQMLFKNEVSSGNIKDLNHKLLEDFRQKSFFEFGLKTALGLILGLLLINFLVFNYYFKKANNFTETATLNKAGIENVAKLKSRIKDKEQKLEDFSIQSASKSSLKINEIVKSIPSSLLLSEVIYYPLQKKVKENESISFEDKIIKVAGNTLNNEVFTHWIEQTEKLDWIERIVITSFGRDTENKTSFEIKIFIK